MGRSFQEVIYCISNGQNDHRRNFKKKISWYKKLHQKKKSPLNNLPNTVRVHVPISRWSESISIHCTCVQIRTVWCGKCLHSSIKPHGVNHSIINSGVITRLLLGLSVSRDCRATSVDKNTPLSVEMPRVPEGQGFGRVWKHTQVAYSTQFTMENDPAAWQTPGRVPWQISTSDKETDSLLQKWRNNHNMPMSLKKKMKSKKPNEWKTATLMWPWITAQQIITQKKFSTFFIWAQGITALHQSGFPHER